jgi:hypothetical protein
MNNCEKTVAESNYKDPHFLEEWKTSRRKKLENSWLVKFPLLEGLPRVADISLESRKQAAASIDIWEQAQQKTSEGLSARCKRLDKNTSVKTASSQGSARRRAYAVPKLIRRQTDGTWILSPIIEHAKPEKLAKAKALYERGLVKKAQRELACGLLGSVVICPNGHQFCVGYDCGHRFCPDSGPKYARRLFGKYVDRFRTVASHLVPCWPPHSGQKPAFVIAKIDFTLRNTGAMPDRARNRALNTSIKKFCRALERHLGISRRQYGLAYGDEIGGSNTNAHAHGVYVGPWLPNKKKELSRLWSKVTPDGSFIISIKIAKSVEAALAHATKYTAKFIAHSTPERLADLEKSYDRVRRFHVLGAFDKRLLPPEQLEREEKAKGEFGAGRICPHCGGILSEPSGWNSSLVALGRQGLKDLDEVRREIGRQRVFSAAVRGSP